MSTTTTYPTKQLGKNGPKVPALGFGAMGLDAFYGKPPSLEERFKVLDKALELGCTLWDTADVYAGNEDTIGSYFKSHPGSREKVFLATKFANIHKDGIMTVDSTPEYVKESIEKSLKRLGVDYVDLYYCHRLDRKTPIEKTVEAMVELKKAGKIKHIGLSEISSKSLRRACAIHHIDAIQIEYSPFALDIEDPQIDLLKTARELGVAVVAYSPLGRGMFTGQYKSKDDFEEGDFRRISPRFSDENFGKNLKLVDDISAIAKRKNCTAGQLTLAWLLAQGDDIIPIPGTKKVKYLEENIAAVYIKLSSEEEKEIRAAIEKAEIHGARYPEAMSAALFADTPEL